MTNDFVIAKNIVDVYREPDSTSERVTQALMNTPVRASEIIDEWTRVQLPDYTGWVYSDVLEYPIVRGYCEGEDGTCGIPLPYVVVINVPKTPLYSHATGDEIVDELYLSTTLPYIDLNHPQRLRVALPGEAEGWLDRKDVTIQNKQQPFPQQDLSAIISYAQAFLNRPYLWGGVSWRGIDCSGFVQLCYRMVGNILPRDADQQHDALAYTVTREHMQTGDLIFFGNQKITHVALALNESEYIHAEGEKFQRVVINSLDPAHKNYHPRLDQIIWSIKRVRA